MAPVNPVPVGRGRSDDDSGALRRLMVEQQLRQRGIADERVLAAMVRVPRERFVPEEIVEHAYDDAALGIHCHQTISQPYTVAFMAEALELTGNEIVLEIGAGSGYGAAILSQLAREVHTVERIPELAAECRERLRLLGYANVTVHTTDGSLGLPQHAPYDGIVVTAGAPQLPAPLVEQLAIGGRLVIPIGTARSSQQMTRFTRYPDGLVEERLGHFAFVPLIGTYGWPSE
ncbi:MAG: protein-L-isoaspartate(D-aspartate) O-methyltransferase [Pirellulaceae bacterium]